MTELKNWLNSQGVSDLGENALLLLELVKSKKNSRFMDIGVRGGASSAILSYQAKENNNLVCGCDLNFDLFFANGKQYVNDDYTCYLYDSVTLGKEWDEDPFDIIFIDTEHTRECVLSELYFWSNHIKERGYFVFHDSHWENSGVVYPVEMDGKIVQHERVDVAITDFFGLPKSVREMTHYEDDNVIIQHHTPSFGMTFVQVKTLDAIEKFKKNVEWNEVFKTRNWLINLIVDENNPKCISKDWGLEYDEIKYEPVININ